MSEDERAATQVAPYHVITVEGLGRVRGEEHCEGHSLDLLRATALKQGIPNEDIEDDIDRETANRSDMRRWERLLSAAVVHAMTRRNTVKNGRSAAGTPRYEIATWFALKSPSPSERPPTGTELP